MRTVPVATGDQFLLHPASRLGMGGGSAALDDTLADPFVNPAKGARVDGGRLVSAPTAYGISGGNGSGRTLPVSLLLGSGAWFGGATVALQEVERAGRERGPGVLPDRSGSSVVPPRRRFLADESAVNSYAAAYLGRRLAGGGVAVAAAASAADLGALQGVGNLYAGSDAIRQSGHMTDFRTGLVWDGEDGRSFEALVLHRRLRVTHDVAFEEFVRFDVCTTRPCGERRLRQVRNLDHTNTSGLHLGYVAPLGTHGWRIGGSFTANRKTHPKIPNYEIMSIPRDPGDTWAYSFAAGVAGGSEGTVYAVEVAYQPAWTETWAVADTAVAKDGGGVIPPGGRTVDNDFSFANVGIRMGLGLAFDPAEVQLGLGVRSVDYTLEQVDHVARDFRRQDEGWLEWTPSWGASVELSDLTLRYTGRLTAGTGRPGVARSVFDAASPGLQTADGVDFLPAPRGPLTLDEAAVLTNRLAVEIPLR